MIETRMTAEDLVRRTWQSRHVLMVQAGGTGIENWEVRVNPADWLGVLLSMDSMMPFHWDADKGSWFVHGMPVAGFPDVEPGTIKVRSEVAA